MSNIIYMYIYIYIIYIYITVSNFAGKNYPDFFSAGKQSLDAPRAQRDQCAPPRRA